MLLDITSDGHMYIPSANTWVHSWLFGGVHVLIFVFSRMVMFKITCKVKTVVWLFVYTVSHKQKMTLKQQCDNIMIKIICTIISPPNGNPHSERTEVNGDTFNTVVGPAAWHSGESSCLLTFVKVWPNLGLHLRNCIPMHLFIALSTLQ
jgi:hypothetical protein